MKVNADVDMAVAVTPLRRQFRNQANAIVMMIAVVKISRNFSATQRFN